MIRLGVDTGGTFTDFVWLDEDGRFVVRKALSTPRDPSVAILDQIASLDLPGSAEVVHGSTVATNALLERKGARVALITTAGFEDVLAIGRQNRPDIYALVPQKRPPLVPAHLCFGADERVTAEGEVLRPLQVAAVNEIVAALVAAGVEAVAICLLFSFLYPQHERLLRQNIEQRLSGIPISLSSELLPEFREYERASTTAINAYVTPIMSRYLTRLGSGLGSRRLQIMQSNGRLIGAKTAADQAARTVLSGPAGGVVGARFAAAQAGFDQIITFDMGGTSTDVALCPGELPMTARGTIDEMPLRLPAVDIHTVGAGGGSLAYLDAGSALHVGPESAGAEPGPACYGRDPGDWRLVVHGRPIPYRVTTTDANLVLGRLDPEYFLGGQMKLNRAAAVEQLQRLAAELELQTVEEAAWAVLQVSNAHMERAIRRISVERGYDPRDYVLVAFGGAGPLHACELAAILQIPRVLVPRIPGVLSAMGMLASNPARDYSQTVMFNAGAASDMGEELGAAFRPLEESAIAAMRDEGFDTAGFDLLRTLDMRYTGQSHELPITYHEGAGETIVEAFHQAHQVRYGYRRDGAPVEIINVRLTAVGRTELPQLPRVQTAESDATAAQIHEGQVWFASGPLPANFYLRSKLGHGHHFAGPAVVVQYDSTATIPPDWSARVDAFGNLILDWKGSLQEPARLA
jgi:N-methylhydantoinase A